jgi:hypothetical protein
MSRPIAKKCIELASATGLAMSDGSSSWVAIINIVLLY